MNQSNQPPSFNDTFSKLYSSSLGLIEQEQFDATEQQPIYQGMTIKALNTLPIYNSDNSEPNTYQNEADRSSSLNQYSLAVSSLETNYILDNDDLSNITPEELDRYLGSDDTASGELTFTKPSSDNAMYPPLQGVSSGKAFVTSSKDSSHSIVRADQLCNAPIPLNENKAILGITPSGNSESKVLQPTNELFAFLNTPKELIDRSIEYHIKND